MLIRKQILVCLIFFFLITALAFNITSGLSDFTESSPAGKNGQYVPGDVDYSGNITVSDAILVLREIVGLTDLKNENEEAWQRADVNLDGTLTVGDAILILRYIVGLTDAFIPVDSPVVHTETAFVYVLRQTDSPIINLARDITLSEESVQITRDITLNGRGDRKNHAITGEIIISEAVQSFTAKNMDTSVLTLNGGGRESVLLNNTNAGEMNVNDHITIKLQGDTHIIRAFFFSKSTVWGGSRIEKAWIHENLAAEDVNFADDENPRKPVFKSEREEVSYEKLNIENADGRLDSEDGTIARVAAATESIIIISVDEGETTITAESGSGETTTVHVRVSSEGAIELEIFPYKEPEEPAKQTANPVITPEEQVRQTVAGIENGKGTYQKEVSITIEGSAEAEAAISITGGKQEAQGEADSRGDFSIEVIIRADFVSTFTVTAQSAGKLVSEETTVVITHETVFPEGTELRITEHPRETAKGRPVEPAPSIQLFDGSGEPIAYSDLPVTVSLIKGNFLSGTLTVLTNNSGAAVFDDLIIAETGTAFKLGFSVSVTSIKDVLSNEFPVVSSYKLTLSAKPGVAGSVTGGNLYKEGETVTVEALAGNDYEFVQWIMKHEINFEYTDPAEITFNMPAKDIHVTAQFYFAGDAVFEVYPDDKRISGSQWSVNTSINITVNEKKYIAQSGRRGWESSHEFNYFGDEDFKLKAGDRIMVSDGITTKEHIVSNLMITEIDEENSKVSGKAPSESVVTVLVLNESQFSADAIAGKNEIWTADFPQGSIKSGGNYRIMQRDNDGDATGMEKLFYESVFTVELDNNNISGSEWPAGHEIMLTVDNGKPDKEPFSKTSFVADNGSFDIGLSGYDINIGSGHEITVVTADRIYKKRHRVIDIIVKNIDEKNDAVSGITEMRYGVVDILVFSEFETYTESVDVEEGVWICNFPDDTIKAVTHGSVSQKDSRGNVTRINWRFKKPYFYVELDNQCMIWGKEWPAGEVTIRVYNDGKLFEKLVVADERGVFGYNFANDNFDIKPGYIVTVSAGKHIIYNRTHQVKKIELTNIDIKNSIISGTAESDGSLYVTAITGPEMYTRKATVSQNSWTAEFAEGEITPETTGFAEHYDSAGNFTRFVWRASGSAFYIVPELNLMLGTEWLSGETVTVSAYKNPDEIFNDNEMIFTEEASLDESGQFVLLISEELSIIPGQVFVVTDGINTRIHEVKQLEITDFQDNIARGTADYGNELYFSIITKEFNFDNIEIGFADLFLANARYEDNNWVADLSEYLNDFYEETDILLVFMFDENWSATIAPWGQALPTFYYLNIQTNLRTERLIKYPREALAVISAGKICISIT